MNSTIWCGWHGRRKDGSMEAAEDFHEQTLVWMACNSCRPDVLEVLLAAGASYSNDDLLSCIVGFPYDDLTRLHSPDLAPAESSLGYGPGLCLALQIRNDCAMLLMESGATYSDKIISKDGCRIIHVASETGAIHQLRLLIEAKASVNVAKSNGSTPLYKAAQQNQISAMRILVVARADLNAQFVSGATALFIAASNGHHECVQVLLEAGADRNVREHIKHMSALDQARVMESKSCVRLLETAPAPEVAPSQTVLPEELIMAIQCRQHRWLRHLLSLPFCNVGINDLLPTNPTLRTLGLEERAPMLVVASILHVIDTSDYGCVDTVSELLARGADPNVGTEERGLTALQAACRGSNDVVSLLLRHKADPNHVDRSADNDTKSFALMEACGSAKATLKIKDEKVRAIRVEAKLQCVRMLIDHDADVNMADGEGFSALTACAEWGLFQLCKLLIRRRADVNVDSVADNQGYRPIFAAVASSRSGAAPEIVRLLLDARADTSGVCNNRADKYPQATLRTWCMRGSLFELLPLIKVEDKADVAESSGPNFRVKGCVKGNLGAVLISVSVHGNIEWDEKELTSTVAAERENGYERVLKGGKICGSLACRDKSALIQGQFSWYGKMMFSFEAGGYIFRARSYEPWPLHLRQNGSVHEGSPVEFEVLISARNGDQGEGTLRLSVEDLGNWSFDYKKCARPTKVGLTADDLKRVAASHQYQVDMGWLMGAIEEGGEDYRALSRTSNDELVNTEGDLDIMQVRRTVLSVRDRGLEAVLPVAATLLKVANEQRKEDRPDNALVLYAHTESLLWPFERKERAAQYLQLCLLNHAKVCIQLENFLEAIEYCNNASRLQTRKTGSVFSHCKSAADVRAHTALQELIATARAGLDAMPVAAQDDHNSAEVMQRREYEKRAAERAAAEFRDERAKLASERSAAARRDQEREAASKAKEESELRVMEDAVQKARLEADQAAARAKAAQERVDAAARARKAQVNAARASSTVHAMQLAEEEERRQAAEEQNAAEQAEAERRATEERHRVSEENRRKREEVASERRRRRQAKEDARRREDQERQDREALELAEIQSRAQWAERENAERERRRLLKIEEDDHLQMALANSRWEAQEERQLQRLKVQETALTPATQPEANSASAEAPEDEECISCFEDGSEDPLMRPCKQCPVFMHYRCASSWRAGCRARKVPPSCPHCRWSPF